MNELVSIKKMQGTENAVVSSLEVAKHFHKRHDHLIETIENQYEDVPNFGEMFRRSNYKDSYGRNQKLYYMNRDGFSLLVMGFTGKKALEWKLKYIQAFNHMEKLLTEKQTENWQLTRGQGKEMRRELTDVLKEYVELAESQGHHGTAKFAYSNFTKLIKKPFGTRENAGTAQLAMIAAVEHILAVTLQPLVKAGKDAKEIYCIAKQKVEALTGVMLPALPQ